LQKELLTKIGVGQINEKREAGKKRVNVLKRGN
jgi:hypothetical protein